MALMLVAGDASGQPARTFAFRDGAGNVIAFTPPTSVSASVTPRTRSCTYQIPPGDMTALVADLTSPDVQAALHANVVLHGEDGELRVGNDAIKWSRKAPTVASYTIRLFELELGLELTKARVRCL